MGNVNFVAISQKRLTAKVIDTFVSNSRGDKQIIIVEAALAAYL